ncbi:TetR/AcrR family transcriptional regulator [Paraburkholderia flagellata]|uniref:TetR/AcrR family transcriptional regulator n=1 Tax=Paraburkholderia flagellata TaxID=2883241 RepID=UPI001F3F786C|nr:TetR/AcrR family transcriptional regulator [Paraburkholderia flagellata]
MAKAGRKKPLSRTENRSTDGVEGYQQRVSREKRKLILEVAITTFLQSGYDAATMDSIGDRAAVSYATLYKHFPSKETLFVEAVDHLIHELFSRWKDHPVPPEVEPGLREIGRAYCELVSDTRLIATMRLIIGEVRTFPDMGSRFQLAKHLFSDITDAWLQKRIDEGKLRIAAVPLARAEFIGMLGETLFYPRLTQIDYAISDEQAEKIVESAVSTFLGRYRVQ